MVKNITIDDNNTIIDKNSNFFIYNLNNKSLENKKRNKSSNIEMII